MAPVIKVALVGILFAVGMYYLKQYSQGGWCDSTVTIDGKVLVITGANTGIGKETALNLVRRGGKVYMGCRSLDRGNAAANDIKALTGVGEDRLIVMKLDLSSLASVRTFVQQFKQRESKLDILINNAGVMWVPFSHTEDGFETTFAVNHLGHFLLTNLLLDTIIAAAPSRIVTVSSRAHEMGTIDFDNLNGERDYNRMTHYGHSKVANVMFSAELGRKLKGTGVTTYSLHPGSIITELSRHLPTWLNNDIVSPVLGTLIWPFVKDIPHGAQTQICCAIDPKLATETGKYYSDCEEKLPAPVAMVEEDARRLWDVSIDMVKLQPHEMSAVVKKR